MDEFDIVVVGGGPAGLSAAVRAVWLGTGDRAYQARVLLLEACDEVGGLARWQPLQINAPGILFTKREIRALARACRAFEVRIEHDEVRGIETAPGGWKVVAGSRGAYRCLAVVLATGCRRSFSIEPALFHEKRLFWFLSDDHLADLAREIEARDGARRIAVLGSASVARTRAVLDRAGTRLEIAVVAEPPHEAELPPGVVPGRVAGIVERPDSTLEIRVALPGGAEVEHGGFQALLVDFDSYARRASSTHFLEGSVPVGPNGFLRTGPDMAVTADGILAAGDVTGPPLSIAKAIHEGTAAGFAAYSHVHARRLGRPPDLFPYYPHPR